MARSSQRFRDTCPAKTTTAIRYRPGRRRRSFGSSGIELFQVQGILPELRTCLPSPLLIPVDHLRHSKFAGLREDKDARTVIKARLSTAVLGSLFTFSLALPVALAYAVPATRGSQNRVAAQASESAVKT